MAVNTNVSRRNLLKGAAGVALTGMAAGTSAALADAAAEGSWDLEYDVVVVGLGAAGASAAIEAHDAGARVLVIEKQPENAHFPNTRLSGGYFHAPDPAGDHDALVEYCKAMMSGENCPWKLEGEQPHVSQEIAEMFAEGVLHTAEFLKAQSPDLDESCFVPGGSSSFPMFPGFEDALYGSSKVVRYANFGDADKSLRPYDQDRLTKSAGEAFYWALVQDGVRTRRPGIDVMYETPASELVMEDGEVRGVVATNATGEELRICANRAVVLTCGGFEYNAEMRRAFLEGPGVDGWVFYGTTANTGDGIRMAMKLGAGLAKVAKSASRIEVGVPYGEQYEKDGLKLGLASAITSSQHSMIVDNFGKRFTDEFIITDSSRPYRYQFYKEVTHYDLLSMGYPRIPSWIVFDQELFESKSAVSQTYSNSGYGMVQWSADNHEAVENGWILKADTLEELAEKILADPENREMITAEQLVASVEAFNAYCEAGEDPDFGRSIDTMAPVTTPPFYAMKLYPGGPNTKGGIDANANRQVLDWSGEPIARLYTAGEISSVFKFTYQAGGNLTEGIVCGRVAGQQAAAQASWTGHDAPASDKADVDIEPSVERVEEGEIPEAKLEECADGTYTASVSGMNGSFDVTVTVADHAIVDIQVGENSETAGLGKVAIEELPGLIVEAQTTDIDVHSGASVTSRAIFEGVKKCLLQASAGSNAFLSQSGNK